jgi:hypothetical protein
MLVAHGGGGNRFGGSTDCGVRVSCCHVRVTLRGQMRAGHMIGYALCPSCMCARTLPCVCECAKSHLHAPCSRWPSLLPLGSLTLTLCARDVHAFAARWRFRFPRRQELRWRAPLCLWTRSSRPTQASLLKSTAACCARCSQQARHGTYDPAWARSSTCSFSPWRPSISSLSSPHDVEGPDDDEQEVGGASSLSRWVKHSAAWCSTTASRMLTPAST